MGATSVTGISGAGSVEGSQKGSERDSISIHKLIGPKIVACGVETLSGTTGVIELPAQTGVVGDYVVMLQTDTATAGYVSTAMAATSSGDWSFGVTAASGAVVAWTVVKKGL